MSSMTRSRRFPCPAGGRYFPAPAGPGRRALARRDHRARPRRPATGPTPAGPADRVSRRCAPPRTRGWRPRAPPQRRVRCGPSPAGQRQPHAAPAVDGAIKQAPDLGHLATLARNTHTRSIPQRRLPGTHADALSMRGADWRGHPGGGSRARPAAPQFSFRHRPAPTGGSAPLVVGGLTLWHATVQIVPCRFTPPG